MTERNLPSSAPRTLHCADLRDKYDTSDDRPVATLDEANVVSSVSAEKPGVHYPVFDIDFPAALVPSSTEGHFHLYLDAPISDDAYWKLCDALVEAGILQAGYVGASKTRGYTSIRLPWVRKAVQS